MINYYNIDINKRIGFNLTRFPDGQTHVDITSDCGTACVVATICTAEDLMVLMQVCNALDNRGRISKDILFIRYLMGARSDRVMRYGGSFDLQVVAKMINLCEFNQVRIFDPHSNVATLLINNSISIEPDEFIKAVTHESVGMDDYVLVCPDTGASKKLNYYNFNGKVKDIVYCIKDRELSTGKITLKVLEPEKCTGRNVLIVDDICDGGATFNIIAEQLKGTLSNTLAVTHGIFSKGFDVLSKNFSRILTTDSLLIDYGNHKFLEVIGIFEESI